MKKLSTSRLQTVTLTGLMVTLALMTSFAFVTRISLANDTTVKSDMSQVDNSGEPVLHSDQVNGSSAQVAQEVLSSQLSYYFVGGNEFTPAENADYFRQDTGCVRGMPLGISFQAPVHLPQGSQVVSITAYTHDFDLAPTTSKAYFIVGDGMGSSNAIFSVENAGNTTDYQQITSTENNPHDVNNQNENYTVKWSKTWSNTAEAGDLNLCGVRVAYYAPVGSALFLPAVSK